MKISRGQVLGLCSVALLSPILRLYPALSAQAAGKAAWLSVLLALPPLLGYTFFLSRLPCGLCELSEQGLGRRFGRTAELLLGFWLLLEASFTLRAGAERMILALFPSAGPGLFVICMGLLALIAALGPLRSLLRFARMVLPFMLAGLALVLISALGSADLSELWPLRLRDLSGALRGTLPVLDTLGLGLYLPWLLLPRGLPGKRFRDWALWLGEMSLLFLGLAAAILGHFGAELSAGLSLPFFTLVRNLVFSRSLERLEALVVALWIFPDFLLSAALLYGAQRCLRLALGKAPEPIPPRRRDLSGGRWLIPLCACLCIGLGLIMAPDQRSLELWSRQIIPACNLIAAFGLVPIIYIVGTLKKKRQVP